VLRYDIRTSVAGQDNRMLAWQYVCALVGGVVDDAAHHHSTKPLADIALLESGRLCDFRRSGWRHLQHGFYEARFVTDAHEDGKRTAIQGGKQAVEQVIDPGLVK
jgi:hypothetical protein